MAFFTLIITNTHVCIDGHVHMHACILCALTAVYWDINFFLQHFLFFYKDGHVVHMYGPCIDASHRLRCLLFDRRFYTWVGCKFQFHTLKTTQSCLGYLGYWCCIKFPNFCPELWWSAQQQQKKSLTHMSFMLNSDHYIFENMFRM